MCVIEKIHPEKLRKLMHRHNLYLKKLISKQKIYVYLLLIMPYVISILRFNNKITLNLEFKNWK